MSLLVSKKSLSNLAALQILRCSFQPCWQFLVKILKTTMEGSIRAIYIWPWNENVQTIQKQQKNGNRVNWLVYRTDGWLREHSAEKTSCPRTCWKLTNTSLWRDTATWLANQTIPSPYQGFLWWEMKRPCFDLFIHWLLKQITNTYWNHFSRSYENRS